MEESSGSIDIKEENTYPVKLAVSVNCHCIDFLATNFKFASHVHDTCTSEKIVMCSFKIIIRLPAFLKIKSAFCD